MSSVATIAMVVFLLIVAAVGFGVRYILAKRKRFLNAMNAGYAEGTAAPGNATAPRGVGGYTAAETTAMAEHMLNAFGKKPAWAASLDRKAQAALMTEASTRAEAEASKPIEPQ